MRVSTRAVLGVAAAVTLLAGCGSGPAAPPAPSPVTAAAPPAGPIQTGPPPAAATGGDAQASDLPTAADPPMTWDAAAQASATAAATTAVNAWIRKDLPPAPWWAGMLPYLTVGAQADYAGTDQAQVPGSRIKRGAQAALGDRGTAYLAVVAVPTDAGPYTVLLERGPEVGTDAEHWLASRLTPPRGQ